MGFKAKSLKTWKGNRVKRLQGDDRLSDAVNLVIAWSQLKMESPRGKFYAECASQLANRNIVFARQLRRVGG